MPNKEKESGQDLSVNTVGGNKNEITKPTIEKAREVKLSLMDLKARESLLEIALQDSLTKNKKVDPNFLFSNDEVDAITAHARSGSGDLKDVCNHLLQLITEAGSGGIGSDLD